MGRTLCMQCRFKRSLATMEPGESITITYDALVAHVERQEVCDREFSAEVTSADESPEASAECCSVPEMAKRFRVGDSTARAWCGAGIFGDPAELKVGRRWAIPEARVSGVEAKLAEGWRIVDNQWVQPGADHPSEKGETEPASASKAQLKRPRNRSVRATSESVNDQVADPASRGDSVSVRTDVRVVVAESVSGRGGDLGTRAPVKA